MKPRATPCCSRGLDTCGKTWWRSEGGWVGPHQYQMTSCALLLTTLAACFVSTTIHETCSPKKVQLVSCRERMKEVHTVAHLAENAAATRLSLDIDLPTATWYDLRLHPRLLR
ncbi:hypothetical protein PI125_g16557 [Phytophthora idaei]|nr:hypothetical protein PI125_g16557 [Phytophthora idaei]